jgi:serine/threonine-protein kinase
VPNIASEQVGGGHPHGRNSCRRIAGVESVDELSDQGRQSLIRLDGSAESMTPRTRSVAASARRFAKTVALGSFLAVLAGPGVARAEGGDATTAEALFRQGKQMLEAKDYARACPMLAESYRLDPATGALLALATCHEQQGALATAWSEFAEAASRAQREGRADRVSVAKERAQAIEPKLSTLTITVPGEIAGLPGFELRRDGVALGQVVFGVPVPIDGGEHTVQVVATGKQTWRTTVSVGREKDKKTVSVSSLDTAASAAVLTPTSGAPAATGAAPSSVAPTAGTPGVAPNGATPPSPISPGLASMQIGGLAVGGAGVLGIVVGSVFGLRAISDNNKSGCGPSTCPDEASLKARADARSAGNVSTISFVAGGVLAAAGVTLFVLGGQKQGEKASISVMPAVAASQWELALRGAF